MTKSDKNVRFWRWFFGGLPAAERKSLRIPGWRTAVTWWLLLDAAVGFVFAMLSRSNADEVAKSVLVPMVSLLVAMAFAWSGSAQSIIASDQTEGEPRSPSEVRGIAFRYQLNALIILFVTVVVSIIAGGSFEGYPDIMRGIAAGLMMTAARQTWRSISSTTALIVVRSERRTRQGVRVDVSEAKATEEEVVAPNKRGEREREADHEG